MSPRPKSMLLKILARRLRRRSAASGALLQVLVRSLRGVGRGMYLRASQKEASPYRSDLVCSQTVISLYLFWEMWFDCVTLSVCAAPNSSSPSMCLRLFSSDFQHLPLLIIDGLACAGASDVQLSTLMALLLDWQRPGLWSRSKR